MDQERSGGIVRPTLRESMMASGYLSAKTLSNRSRLLRTESLRYVNPRDKFQYPYKLMAGNVLDFYSLDRELSLIVLFHCILVEFIIGCCSFRLPPWFSLLKDHVGASASALATWQYWKRIHIPTSAMKLRLSRDKSRFIFPNFRHSPRLPT